MTTAVKWLIIANAVMFVATLVYPPIIQYLGLSPELVVERQWLWQLVTYLFLHGSAVHILLNMLGLWMFGVELERRWGTRPFGEYYAVTGIGANESWTPSGAPVQVATPGSSDNLDCGRNVFHPRFVAGTAPGSIRLIVAMSDCPDNGFEDIGFDDDPWAIGEIRLCFGVFGLST